MDDEKKPGEQNFNAKKEEADKIAAALKEYANKDEGESFYGAKDGDVVRWFDNEYEAEGHSSTEYFPPQLTLEDIQEIINNDGDKQKLMIEKGVDPKTTSSDKLRQYLHGDWSPMETTHTREDEKTKEVKRMTEEEYVAMLTEQYTELWDKRQEEKAAAKETLKATAENQTATDTVAVEEVLAEIKNIPETPPAVPAQEATSQAVADVEEPITPSKPTKKNWVF